MVICGEWKDMMNFAHGNNITHMCGVWTYMPGRLRSCVISGLEWTKTFKVSNKYLQNLSQLVPDLHISMCKVVLWWRHQM